MRLCGCQTASTLYHRFRSDSGEHACDPGDHSDLRVSGAAEVRGCLPGDVLVDLDGYHDARRLGEQGGVVPGRGADSEDSVAGFRACSSMLATMDGDDAESVVAPCSLGRPGTPPAARGIHSHPRGQAAVQMAGSESCRYIFYIRSARRIE